MATEIETYKLYNGEVELNYYPNSHMYKVNGQRIIGVTTITGVINKEALMLWPLNEAMTYLRRELLSDVILEALDKPGIETILREAAEAYQKKSTRGTDAGTLCHDWLEQFLRAKKEGAPIPAVLEPMVVPAKDEFDDNYIRAIDYNNLIEASNNLIEWFEEKKVEVLEVERIIYSRKYDYAGRFDAVLRIGGKIYLVDFKTSNPAREYPNGIYPENFCQTGGYEIALTEEQPGLKVDGHLIINLSKKSGKINFKYDFDTKTNKEWFLYTLGCKRGMQEKVRKNSILYAENRPGGKKK